MTPVARAILEILLLGMTATLAMISIMFASQNFGWSRLNLPFLLGTVFTDDRRSANALGFFLYLVIGWLFALFYYLMFGMTGHATWWRGAIGGFLHGVLLLSGVLPFLAYVHPRVASEHDGPDIVKKLEPPGFLALHYGRRTPLVTLVAHVVYGMILGAGFTV
jgi:hypothetical protein